MPVMNGFAATSEIRAFERTNHMQPTKVIALTGLGSAGSQQEAFSSGADLFLTKPVSMKALRGLLAGDDGGVVPGGVGSPSGSGPSPMGGFPAMGLGVKLAETTVETKSSSVVTLSSATTTTVTSTTNATAFMPNMASVMEKAKHIRTQGAA
jgi:PleD family two-component response regulator